MEAEVRNEMRQKIEKFRRDGKSVTITASAVLPRTVIGKVVVDSSRGIWVDTKLGDVFLRWAEIETAEVTK